eukprot:EG_transcript_27937
MKLLWLLALCASLALGAIPRLGGVPTIDFSCSKPDDLLTGQKVVIDPPEIKGNQHLTITAWGTLKQDVAGGTIRLKALLDGIPLLALSLDLCEQVGRVGQSCPLKQGFSNMTVGFDIPAIPLAGSVEADILIATNDASPKEVICVRMKVTLP